MTDLRIRRALLAVAVPAALALAIPSAMAQSSNGSNNAATLSNQMPPVSPAQSGPGPTPSAKNEMTKRPAPVNTHRVRAKPGQSKIISPH